MAEGLRETVERGLEAVERPRWSGVALLLVLAATLACWFHLGRGLSLRGDDIDFVLYRRGWTTDAFLQPHVDHLTAVGILGFHAMWAIFGIGDFTPYLVLNLVLFACLLSTAFMVFRRRTGTPMALVLVTLVAAIGPGSDDVLWAFQGQFLFCLTLGTATFLTLDRRDRRGDLATGLLLLFAVGSASFGIVFIATVALELVLSRQWRRGWLLVVPVAPYLVWRTMYGPSEVLASPSDALEFVVKSFSGTLGAVAGTFGSSVASPNRYWGVALALLVLAGAARWLHVRGRPSAREVSAIALPFLSWVVTGIARADTSDPLVSRYLLPAALFLAIAAAHMLPRWRPGAWPAVLAVLLVFGAATSNFRLAANDAVGLRAQATNIRSQLGAIELARPTVDPGFIATPLQDFGNFRALPYFQATDAVGSFALDESGIQALSSPERAVVDATMASAVRLAAAPASDAVAVATRGAPHPTIGSDVRQRRPAGEASGCVTLSPSTTGVHQADTTLPLTGVRVEPSDHDAVAIRVRRWSDDVDGQPIAVVRSASDIASPLDRASTPWKLQLTFTRTLSLCRLGTRFSG